MCNSILRQKECIGTIRVKVELDLNALRVKKRDLFSLLFTQLTFAHTGMEFKPVETGNSTEED